MNGPGNRLFTTVLKYTPLSSFDMWSWFKTDPVKKLRKQYEQKMVEARDLQRKGDIQAFAQKSAEAEALMKEIERLSRRS